VSVADGRGVVEACQVREQGLWEVLEMFGEAFAASSVEELAGGGDAGYYLLQIALQNAVAERMRIAATIDIHRALSAGVALGEIAHVLGVGTGQVADRWRSWAAGQRRLAERCPGLGLERAEYDKVVAVLDGRVDVDFDQFRSCACRGEDTQIGSPRP
jgi:hypothetical protein